MSDELQRIASAAMKVAAVLAAAALVVFVLWAAYAIMFAPRM